MKVWYVGLALLIAGAGGVNATPGDFDQYIGGATAVVKEGGSQAILDQGGAICNKGNPSPSIGGGCIPFGPWDSVHVIDVAAREGVAFQVCIDNNGDGLCGGPDPAGCGDDIFFSHADGGAFFNPLGPLPTGFRTGCLGGGWPGYVVLLCEGVHNAGPPHVHNATVGGIGGTSGGTGFGDFCQGEQEAPAKPYLVN